MPTSETLDLPAPATEREARPAFGPQRYAGAIVAVTAALLTALAVVLIDAGSAARAFVGGESRWSKAQKSAMLALVAYAADGDEAHWQT